MSNAIQHKKAKTIFIALLSIAGLQGLVGASPLPPVDYQLIEYIEATGQQTIDTGIEATSNSTIAIDFALNEIGATKYLVSSGLSPENADTQLCLRLYLNGNNLWACGASSVFSGNDAHGSWSILYEEVPVVGKRVELVLDSPGNEVRFNGKRVMRLTHPRNGKGRETIKISPNLPTSTPDTRIKGRVYKMQISSAGVLQANLVPCRRKSDGEKGLYDLVRDVFLTNENLAATEGFGEGPEMVDRAFVIEPIDPQGLSGEGRVTPAPVVRTAICGRLLDAESDYSVSYSDNDTAGTATVVVNGKGEYAGVSASRTFDVFRIGGAFRLASWNVGHWSCGAASSSSILITSEDYGFGKTLQYKEKIGAIGADWFGTCEYSSDFVRGGWADAAESVFQRYPSFRIGPSHDYQWNAVFHSGRFRILETKVQYYPTHTQTTYAYAHRVLIDDSYEAWFVQTHLDWSDPAIRASQVEWLVAEYADKERVVISGDFNSGIRLSPEMPSRTCVADYERFAAGGFTVAIPDEPTCSDCIYDNILVKGFAIGARTVIPHEGLSDHNAVAVTLEPLGSGRVAKPTAVLSPVYDGTAHVPSIAANPAYIVSCPAKTDAGSYSAVVSLVDKDSTSWEDGTKADVTVPFTIVKSPNVWTRPPSLSSTNWDSDETVEADEGAAQFGTPTASYTQAELDALKAGEYVYSVTVSGGENYDSLTTNISFVIQAAFTATPLVENGLVTGADVSFGASERRRVLSVFYDDVDRGASCDGWAGQIRLAEIPAGETSVTVALPRTVGREYGCFRFALSYDSSSYVQDGLVAQWDARENSGRGAFDPTTKVWKDLVGSLDISAPDWDFSSEDTVVKPDGDYRVSVAASDILAPNNSSNKTLEVVFRTTDSFDFTSQGRCDVVNLGYYGMISLRGYDSYRLVSIFVRRNGGDNKGLYTYNKGSQYNSIASLCTFCSYSSVFAAKIAESSLNVNDTLFTTGTSPSYATGGPFNTDVGTIFIGGTRGSFHISSIRVYNRALTDAERTTNYQIDDVRYLGDKRGFVEFTKKACTVEVPLNAEIRKGADWLCADVGFAPSAKCRRKLFAAFGKDRGSRLIDWKDAIEIAEVEKGVNCVHDIDLTEYRGKTGLRFFLQDFYDSTSYVQDGLYGQWDGVENAGRGVHDPNRTTSWKNLYGDNEGLDLIPQGTAATMTVGDSYIKVPKGGRLYATVPGIDGTVPRTVEGCGYVGEDFDLKGSARCDFMDAWHDCTVSFRGDQGYYIVSVFVNAGRTGYYMVPNDKSVNCAASLLSPQSYSLYYQHHDDLSVSNLRINGNVALGCGCANKGKNTPDGTGYCYNTATLSHSNLIGVSPGQDARGSLYVNTMRVYLKKLTDDERDWNAHVDGCRFAGKPLPESASSYFRLGRGFIVIVD